MLQRLTQSPPLFLASVTGVEEAQAALASGADIIDCKAPDQGALGALPVETVRAIAGRLPPDTVISATIGDLPATAGSLVPAAEAMAATGVGIVKAGFFGGGDAAQAIRALGRSDLGGARLYAVLMADRAPDFSLIPVCADAGFLGVMLDTAGKTSGALTDVMDHNRLSTFVQRAKAAGLVTGLAGSLSTEHVAQLCALKPDILGFRGALCASGRSSALDSNRVRQVRDALDRATSAVTGRSVV